MKKIRITVIIMMMSVFIALALAGCGDKAPYTTSGECMNGTYELTIYDEEMDADTANRILEDANAEIARIDGILNHKIEGSDVYKVNHAKGERVDVAQEVRDMMSIGILIGNTTSGAFDMTMGPVNDLWGFDTDEPTLPADADIKAALTHVFYGNMATQGSELWMADPEAALDFTGIAPGYIASVVSELMDEAGVKQAKIDICGSIIMTGQESDDTPWTVNLENIKNGEAESIGSIDVANAAVATVSKYAVTLEQGGKVYHHILDPKTGYPVESDVVSATITARKSYSKYCTILANACVLLGSSDAQTFITNLDKGTPDMNLEAILLLEDGTVYKTDGVELITE